MVAPRKKYVAYPRDVSIGSLLGWLALVGTAGSGKAGSL